MFQEILNNLTNIGYAVLIFICAYVANMAFSLWYNIKELGESFEWLKVRDSFLKIVVFAVGLTLLCIAVTALPIFADYIGWTIPEEYADVFADIVIIAAFLTITCKYIKEAFTKFKAILDSGATTEETETNDTDPEAVKTEVLKETKSAAVEEATDTTEISENAENTATTEEMATATATVPEA